MDAMGVQWGCNGGAIGVQWGYNGGAIAITGMCIVVGFLLLREGGGGWIEVYGF